MKVHITSLAPPLLLKFPYQERTEGGHAYVLILTPFLHFIYQNLELYFCSFFILFLFCFWFGLVLLVLFFVCCFVFAVVVLFHFIISKHIVLIDTCIYNNAQPRIIVPIVICCFCVFDCLFVCLFVCFRFFLYVCFCFYFVIIFCLPFSFYYIQLHRVEITIQILIY